MIATYQWLLTITLFTGLAYAQVPCPDECICHQGAVECSSTLLRVIPVLPEDTTILTLDSATFDDLILRPANFSRLTRLTKLVLRGCSIQNIEPTTFSDLKRLTSIDLKQNNLGDINPGSFDGLNLSALFLDDNPNLQLNAETFRGLSTTILNLENCGLTDIAKETINHIQGLEKIFLNDNRITRFNSNLEPLFSTFETIKIYNNPLICDCESRWLKVFYDSHPTKINKGSGTGEDPRCDAPSTVSGSFFSRLQLTDFMCQAPKINARISFQNNQGTLNCWASGNPQPSLAWYGPNGLINQTTPTSSDSIQIVRLQLTIYSDDQYVHTNYTCVATNNAGNMTITTDIQWPFTNDRTNTQTPCRIHSETTLAATDAATQSMLRSPYFTLVDLISAILGVFVCTLVISVVILHFCVYKRKKFLKASSHNASSNYSSPSTSDSNYSTSSLAEHGHQVSHLQCINLQQQLNHIQNRPLPHINSNGEYLTTELPIGLHQSHALGLHQGQQNRAMTISPSCEICRSSTQSDRPEFRQPS